MTALVLQHCTCTLTNFSGYLTFVENCICTQGDSGQPVLCYSGQRLLLVQVSQQEVTFASLCTVYLELCSERIAVCT